MPPVISLVGKPGSGKTTLLERIIPFLARKGYRVGTIKHHVHAFEMDTPGKDTWRHKQAGACMVALASPSGLGIIRDVPSDPSIDEMTARYFFDADLVITEGYKRLCLPKIEVYRSAVHASPLEKPDETWIAYVSDVPLSANIPCFAPDDVDAIGDFVINRFLSSQPSQSSVLLVDGRPVPLSPEITASLLSALKESCGRLSQKAVPSEITLLIRNVCNPQQ